MYRWTGALLALLTLLPAGLAAQERTEAPRGEARMRVMREAPLARALTVAGMMNRARIGVSLTADTAGATPQGARVVDVVEDGPAADAGLEAGDLITRVGDRDIRGEHAVEDVVHEVGKLDVGDTVAIQYRRGGQTRTARVVTDGGASTYSFGPSLRRLEQSMPMIRATPGAFSFSFGGMHGLEVTELNAGLGEYFGTSEGVLVLDVHEGENTIPLRAGDVITAIGGREPSDAGHARRIIASYEPGERVEFRIMRQRRAQTVEWTVPELRDKVRR